MEGIVIKNRYKNRLAKYSWIFLRTVLLSGFSFLILYPLLVKFSTSLMSEADIFDQTVQWIPKNFDISRVFYRYLEVAKVMEYPRAFLNSLTLSLLVSIIQLISCTIVGYGFGRYEFKGKSFFFALVILTLIIPPQMILIPLFLNFRFFNLFGILPGPGLNLIGTYWPFVIMTVTASGFRNGLFIYIMRQHFKGMPAALEEAAYIDGAGQIKTFYKIMLPGAVPALIIVFLFSFVWQWNDFLLTSTFLRETAILLPFTLMRLGLGFDISEYHTDFLTVINNTGMLLFLAPLLFIYVFVQRHFIESVERSGIVG